MRNNRSTEHRVPAYAEGFVVTMELLLIFAIMVLGSVAAVILVRNSLIKLAETRRAAQLTVKDSADPPLLFGTPVSYDLCEAPQILCPDFGFFTGNSGSGATPGASAGLRALVAIRPDRFASRNQVYFTGDNCSGTAFLAPPAIPGSTNFPPSLPVGYFNCGLQVDSAGDPVCYGVGPPRDWGDPDCDADDELPCDDGGRLYRSSSPTPAAPRPTIRSRWISLNPDCAELTSGAEESSTGGGVPGDQSNVPDGDHSGYTGASGSEGRLTQVIAVTPGDSCTLSLWVGRRAGSISDNSTWFVELVSATTTQVLLTDTTASQAADSWVFRSSPVSVSLAHVAPITFRLRSFNPPSPQTNYDFVSLDCGAGNVISNGSFELPAMADGEFSPNDGPLPTGWSAPIARAGHWNPPLSQFSATTFSGGGTSTPTTTAICDDAFDTDSLDLLPTVQVTSMAGDNVLAPYAPLFNVMAPEAPTFGLVPASDETGVAPATGPQVDASDEVE